MKIEVVGRSASLYLNGSAKPGLIVDGITGEDLHGAIALWSFPGEESYFANLRITPAAPQPVKNGGEAAGMWDVKSITDAAGPVEGSMKLNRDANSLTGTWTGTFGADQPVSGTWRDGYVELTLTGIWPKDRPGTPGNVTLTFAGWIADNTATGRMKIADRADGQWSAKRRDNYNRRIGVPSASPRKRVPEPVMDALECRARKQHSSVQAIAVEAIENDLARVESESVGVGRRAKLPLIRSANRGSLRSLTNAVIDGILGN
jgi:hypothetical protein